MKEIKSVYFTGEPAFLIGSYYTDIGGVQSIPDLVSYCKVANLAGDNINTIYNYQQEEEDWESGFEKFIKNIPSDTIMTVIDAHS